MPKKTIALVLSLIVLAIVLLVVALQPILTPSSDQPTEQSSENQEIATSEPEAATTLRLSPDPLTLTSTQEGRIEVIVDSATNELTAVQLEISYDPEVITNIQIAPGPFFPKPLTLLNSIDAENGRVTYALGITPAQTPVQGTGVVAELTFQVVPGSVGQETMIDLLPKTLVTQQGAGQSVLMSTTGTTVIIPQSQNVTQTEIVLTPTPINVEQ